MIEGDMLIALLIGMIITLGISLYRIGKLLDRIQNGTKIIRINLDRVDDGFDDIIETINRINAQKSQAQRDYEQKMLTDLINELNKKEDDNEGRSQTWQCGTGFENLKRKTQKEGIIRRAREIEFYEKPTQKRQRLKKQNIKNVRKLQAKNTLRPKPHRRSYK